MTYHQTLSLAALITAGIPQLGTILMFSGSHSLAPNLTDHHWSPKIARCWPQPGSWQVSSEGDFLKPIAGIPLSSPLYRNVGADTGLWLCLCAWSVPVPLSGHHLWCRGQATNDLGRGLWTRDTPRHKSSLLNRHLRLGLYSPINLSDYGDPERKAGAGRAHLAGCWRPNVDMFIVIIFYSQWDAHWALRWLLDWAGLRCLGLTVFA